MKMGDRYLPRSKWPTCQRLHLCEPQAPARSGSERGSSAAGPSGHTRATCRGRRASASVPLGVV